MTTKEQLLAKVRTLAIHGYGGEQSNAKEMLERLLKKYGMTEEDLNDDPIITWSYKEPKPKKSYINKLFWQTITLIARGNKLYKDVGYIRNGNLLTIKSPKTFKLEFIETFEFYRDMYLRDLEIFYLAFLKKNSLMLERTDSDKEPTKAEIQKHIDAEMLSTGLKKHIKLKQLEVNKYD